MTDADAVRLLASEYNLEFVDLERYGVDPSAAAVLPQAIAQQHHVVPIGRKFGAPVIAIANPADVQALDTLRAAIGREFISVVAPGDQIDLCLEQLYQGDQANGATGGQDATGDDPLSAALDDALGGSVWGMAFAQSGGTVEEAPPAAAVETVQPPEVQAAAPVPLPDAVAPVAGDPSVAASGVPAAVADPYVDPVTAAMPTAAGTVPVVDPATAVPAEPPVAAPVDPVAATLADPAVAEPAGAPAMQPPPFVPAAVPTPAEVPAPFPAGEGPAAERYLTPEEAFAPQTPTAVFSGAPEPPMDAATQAAMAADLVDEAVAEYEHSMGDTGGDTGAASGELADFPPLARVLVEGGRVPLAEMQEVLDEHERNGQTIARLLTSRGLVTEADLMWGMAQEMGLEFVDLDTYGIDFSAAFELPESTARHHNVVVIGREDSMPIVAASNPTDVFAMDDLRTIIGRSFITVVATRSQISSYIDRAYSPGGDAADVATSAASDFAEDAGQELENIQAVVDDAPIVRYVNLLVLQALNERASDIHVEPTADNLRIRYRIDGVLHDMSTAPRSIAAAVTTRLKVMAEMNIAEHRVPQDGRISLNVGNRGIDLRMATLPTIYGEKVVMRVLDKSNVVLGFEDLGFDADLLERYEGIYTKPYGTILVTGPTGSGKTTTLYATLAALNSPDKNIITVEDPVELRIKGINQVQLNVKAGLTFASALKSILRSDPDIVLVGEIRDRETALISVEAALTGHLVLATLHTNDAASTPMRLVEMGLEPYLVTSAVSAAVAQRLARRLCPHCREPYEPTEAEIAASGWRPEEVFADQPAPKLYRAIGCSACSNTGYRGRKALLELLIVTEEIERMIIEGGSADDIHKLAVEQGMVTLRQSGLRKALEGETTLEEVLRVVA